MTHKPLREGAQGITNTHFSFFSQLTSGALYLPKSTGFERSREIIDVDPTDFSLPGQGVGWKLLQRSSLGENIGHTAKLSSSSSELTSLNTYQLYTK